MNKQEYIDTAEQELLHTYNRFHLYLIMVRAYTFTIQTKSVSGFRSRNRRMCAGL